MHPQFTFDDSRGEAPKNVEPEVGLDLTIVQFDLLALGVKLSNGIVGELVLIE